jgi:hypothetical protein
MALLFAFLTQRSIDVAMERAGGLGAGIWILLALLVPLLSWYLIRRSQLN